MKIKMKRKQLRNVVLIKSIQQSKVEKVYIQW